MMVTPKQLVEVAKKHVPSADISFKISKNMMHSAKTFNIARRLDSSLAERDWGAKLEYDLDETMQDYIKECHLHRDLIDKPIPEV